MSLLNFKNMHYTSYYLAFKLAKDARTVHHGLVGVYGLHCNPNRRAIYLWFEDMQRDWFIFEKRTQPGRPRSSRTPSITQNVQKMTYRDLRMSVRV